MSPLRTASHWNHTPCESCMDKHGLEKPTRSRPQEAACCFCGGARPADLRGRAPAGVTCNGMTAEVEVKEPAAEPPTVKVEQIGRRLGRNKGRLRTVGHSKTVKGKLRRPATDPAPVTVPAKESEKKGKTHAQLFPMSPEKIAEIEAHRAYSKALTTFARKAIQSREARGKDEQFSFVSVAIKDKYRYGEGGHHVLRGKATFVGRKAGTTHLPRRAILVIDRETHQMVAFTIRWKCGGIAVFGKLLESPHHKICPTCQRSEDWHANRQEKAEQKENAA